VPVICGDFVATLPAEPHREWLAVRAVDSSFFEVEASDEPVISIIKSAFRDVRSANGSA
jgi:hypothetical protein